MGAIIDDMQKIEPDMNKNSAKQQADLFCKRSLIKVFRVP